MGEWREELPCFQQNVDTICAACGSGVNMYCPFSENRLPQGSDRLAFIWLYIDALAAAKAQRGM